MGKSGKPPANCRREHSTALRIPAAPTHGPSLQTSVVGGSPLRLPVAVTSAQTLGRDCRLRLGPRARPAPVSSAQGGGSHVDKAVQGHPGGRGMCDGAGHGWPGTQTALLGLRCGWRRPAERGSHREALWAGGGRSRGELRGCAWGEVVLDSIAAITNDHKLSGSKQTNVSPAVL